MRLLLSQSSATTRNQVFEESEAVHERHRVPLALAREHGFGPLDGPDICREDVHLGRRSCIDMLGSQRSESSVRPLDLVSGSVIGVLDLPLDAVHRP